MTDSVLDRLADDERDEALRVTMREYVRQVIGDSRRAAVPVPDLVRMVIGDEPAQHDEPGPARRAVSSRSSKVAAVRDQWKRALETWYATGTAGGRARLGDLTRDELLFNVETREAMARANAAEAATLQRLADALDEHGAERVGDLPDEVLRDVLDDDEGAA